MKTSKKASIKTFEKLAISKTNLVKGGGRGNAAIIVDWHPHN